MKCSIWASALSVFYYGPSCDGVRHSASSLLRSSTVLPVGRTTARQSPAEFSSSCLVRNWFSPRMQKKANNSSYLTAWGQKQLCWSWETKVQLLQAVVINIFTDRVDQVCVKRVAPTNYKPVLQLLSPTEPLGTFSASRISRWLELVDGLSQLKSR